MSAQHTPAVGDMDAIVEIHGTFTNRVNDMAIAMQDATYKIGRKRGLEDGKAQRDELLAALKVAEQSVGELSALETVRAAIAKVEGGAA